MNKGCGIISTIKEGIKNPPFTNILFSFNIFDNLDFFYFCPFLIIQGIISSKNNILYN